MKRAFTLIVLIFLLIAMFPMSVFAEPSSKEAESIIYFDDGSYITIEITSIDTRSTSTRSGKKTYTYHGNNGDIEWKATLSGTFTYNGTTSSCTASRCSVSITDTDWYVVSKTASKSGNSATAELTMGLRYIGITTKKESVSMKLTCDKNGNLS